MDETADRDADIERDLKQVVVFLPPSGISPLDVVHEDERGVQSVDVVREVGGSSPIVRSSPEDGRVDDSEQGDWFEDEHVPSGVGSFAVSPADVFLEIGAEFLSEAPTQSDEPSDQETPRHDRIKLEDDLGSHHSGLDGIAIVMGGGIADKVLRVGGRAVSGEYR